MDSEEKWRNEFREDLENKKRGSGFLGLLNDLKRRPEDAALELGVPIEEINEIIQGKKRLSPELIIKATKIWRINPRDFYTMHDDCPLGVKVMRSDDSKKTSRVMNRGGFPYYEYRDTVMSSVGPFRPEWILELCYVGDNDPGNPDAQWNNGHFMHQFTYFIGNVNFYYIGSDRKKKVAVTKTGDSCYITPFTPHTFATRKGAKTNGLILALTYGSNLTGDTQQELSALGEELGKEFALNFSTKEKAAASLLKFHLENLSISIQELSKRTQIDINKINSFLNSESIPSQSEYETISKALNINVRDLLPFDENTDKVIIQNHDTAKKWNYPDSTDAYEIVQLASTPNLPFSKALEINVLAENGEELDVRVGSHQYVYNVGETDIQLNWNSDGKNHSEIIKPNDSFYIKPFVYHNFRKKGKLIVLRVGGRISGEAQRELSLIGKDNAKRAIHETMQWFNPEEKN